MKTKWKTKWNNFRAYINKPRLCGIVFPRMGGLGIGFSSKRYSKDNVREERARIQKIIAELCDDAFDPKMYKIIREKSDDID